MGDLCYPFPVFQRVLARAELMDRMLVRCGVAPGVAVRVGGGNDWYQARTRCLDCPAGLACVRWLQAETTAGPSDPPAFCPNAAFIATCRAKATRRPRDTATALTGT